MEKTAQQKCTCGHCGEIIEYAPGAAGQVIECPKCKQKSRLPSPSAAEPLELAATPPEPVRSCLACGAALGPFEYTCRACESRRRKVAVLWFLGSAFGLLVIGAIVLAVLNRPAKKPAAVVARPPSTMILTAPVPAPTRGPKSLNDLKPGKFYLQQQRGSTVIVAVGEIQNVSQNVHLNVRVDMDLLDAKGAKISTISDYSNMIRPGDRWQPAIRVTDARVANVRFAGLKED